MSIHLSPAKYLTFLPLSYEITAHDDAHHYWRVLFYFNSYRLITGSVLAIITWQFQFTSFGSHHHLLFLYTSLGYALFSSVSMLLIKLRHPNFNRQLAIQVIGDIVFFSVMLYASGGLQSGLGGLLLVSLAGAGLISRGRMTLFFASMATMSLLLQETYALLTVDSYTAQYSQAGLLGMAYFAVAWLAQQLAKHTLTSEQLAQERGIDLANMTEVNQLVIQDLQEGVLVVDKQGNIRHRNTYAEKLLNLGAPTHHAEFLKLSDHAPEIANRLTSWQGNRHISFEPLRLDYNNALIRTRFVPIQADFRNGVVIFLEDVRRIQAHLQQLKLAALGRLTASIAHEIRNPLSAISHAAELLQEEQRINNIDTRLARIIYDNTKRLNNIVQDVLQLNRRNVSESEPIDTNAFIHKFLEEFCHTENINTNVFIVHSLKDYWINFDRDHLNQIIWNLCCNAWRHCRKKTHSIHIELSAEADENTVYLDIIDDGSGVDPQQIKQIFEPFFTTAASGTGLGLYIARELCEANQASLEYIAGSSGGHLRIICKGSRPYP